MSHFTVLITGDDIEAQMAPFDENLEVPRYLARTKAQIIAEGKAFGRDIAGGAA